MTPSSQRFFFCHIPKAGGTTVGRILKKNFGASFYPWYGLYDRYMLNALDVRVICESYPRLRCFASHRFSLDLPYDLPGAPITAFTLVREPVEHALSWYFYLLDQAKKNGAPLPPPISEFFAPILNGEIQDLRFCNPQSRFLAGQRLDEIDLPFLEQKMRAGQVLAAPLERFDDLLLLLEKRYPRDFTNAAYPGRQNAAPREQEVPVELRTALLEANAADGALYRAVHAIFDSIMREEFGNTLSELRQDFSRRCRAVTTDWLAEEETAALNAEERRLFLHLKRENAELKREVERLGRIPFTNLVPPLQMRHLAALWRRVTPRSHDKKGGS